MKVELVIREGWSETTVKLEGYKFHIETIVEAIKKVFEENSYITIE